MRMGRLEVFVCTNIPQLIPDRTKLYVATDIDWMWWTFRWFKNLVRKKK